MWKEIAIAVLSFLAGAISISADDSVYLVHTNKDTGQLVTEKEGNLYRLVPIQIEKGE